MSRPWRPLLEGALAEQASAVVLDLGRALLTLPETWTYKYSLALGGAGLALLHGYLAEAGLGEVHAQAANRLLDRAIEGVATTSMSASLFPGFTGVAWVTQHLQHWHPEPDADDANQAIDQALIELLERHPWSGPHDLTGGLNGIIVYALERLPRPPARRLLTAVVEHLAELVEPLGDGVAVRTQPRFMTLLRPEQRPEGYFDLGVAHGLTGTVAALAGAHAAGAAVAETGKLLERAVAALLSQRIEQGECAFTHAVGAEFTPARTRSAWCYGDPGVTAALFAAAEAVGEPRWQAEALSIARRAARRPAERGGIADAGFCHGACGLAHLYNRLYQASGDEELGEAARLWYRRTLDLRRPGTGIGGYQAAMNGASGTEWIDDPSVLTGAAGIALALLAGSNALEPAWDRMFLVSLASSRASG